MRLFLLVGSLISNSIASVSLNRTLLRGYIKIACISPADDMPTKMYPALGNSAGALSHWAALSEEEFVQLAKDVVREEHAKVIKAGKVDIYLIEYIDSLRSTGMSDEDITLTSARRYYDILKGFEEFS